MVIDAPGVAYSDAIPEHPVFTISGADGHPISDGHWGRDTSGIGRFFFNPIYTSSFTVTMNAYSATTKEGHHAYGVYVADVKEGFQELDELHSGIVADGETSPIPSIIALTFTKGLPLDGGDQDPTTFGFSAGDRLEIEGEHLNAFGLKETLTGDGSMQTFLYQTQTALVIEPIADPAASMPTAVSVNVTSQTVAARDGVNDRYTVKWDTDPAGAPVDVYRSSYMKNWGNAISILNQAGSYSEPAGVSRQAFFRVAPTSRIPIFEGDDFQPRL